MQMAESVLGKYWLTSTACHPYPAFQKSEKPSHVLLLSDTQVPHTFPYGAFIGSWRRFLADLNLRKNWHVATRLNPDAVVFIGDMLASGRALKTADECVAPPFLASFLDRRRCLRYDRAAQYFKSIFTFRDAPMYYVPGNTDIRLEDF